MHRRSFLVGSGLALAAGFPRLAAAAPPYPAGRPSLVVGFAAGGAGDLAARVVADHAGAARALAVTLDFRPGAGGTIATDQVRRAAPDGTTLSLFSVSPLMVAPHLQAVPYDPARDFTYIAAYAAVSIPVFVRADSPFESWDALLTEARDNPGRLRWASAAPRGLAHIATAAAFRQEGVEATFVPFGGGAEAVTALLGGHIDAVVSSDYGPHLAAGAVRLLIETGPTPSPDQPGLETFAQRGYPLSVAATYGLFGPKGMPAEIVAWWEELLADLGDSPRYRDFLRTAHAQPFFQDSESFSQAVVEGHREIGRQVDVLGLRP